MLVLLAGSFRLVAAASSQQRVHAAVGKQHQRQRQFEAVSPIVSVPTW